MNVKTISLNTINGSSNRPKISRVASFGLVLFSMIILSGLSFGQEYKPTAATFVPYGSLPKKERKQRLKEPAYVQIAAPAEEVKSLFIQSLTSQGYFLNNSSTNALTFTKRMDGVGATILAGLAGGTDMELTFNLSISEAQGISHVNARMFLSTQNNFGRRSYTDGTKVGKQREGLDNLLYSVKVNAER